MQAVELAPKQHCSGSPIAAKPRRVKRCAGHTNRRARTAQEHLLQGFAAARACAVKMTFFGAPACTNSCACQRKFTHCEGARTHFAAMMGPAPRAENSSSWACASSCWTPTMIVVAHLDKAMPPYVRKHVHFMAVDNCSARCFTYWAYCFCHANSARSLTTTTIPSTRPRSPG